LFYGMGYLSSVIWKTGALRSGMMQNKLMILVPITVIVCILILYIYFKRIPNDPRFRWLNVIAVLFFAGAVGNFIDRVMLGIRRRLFLFYPDRFSDL